MQRLSLAIAVSIAVAALCVPSAVADGWRWPAPGKVVTPFSAGADRYAPGQHRGIDVAAEPGTPVVAAVGGTVRFAGAIGTSGLTVSVRSADGRYDTSYLHLSTTSVAAGERIAAGRRIGSAGQSGAPGSDAPHVHFGVRLAGSRHGYVDPLGLLSSRPTARPGGPPVEPVPVGGPVWRVGPAPPRPVSARAFERRARAQAATAGGLDAGWAVACLALISLVALLGRSSIAIPCRTTSQRRSTTSMASPTWATSTRPSPPTSSPGTCASVARPSSS